MLPIPSGGRAAAARPDCGGGGQPSRPAPPRRSI